MVTQCQTYLVQLLEKQGNTTANPKFALNVFSAVTFHSYALLWASQDENLKQLGWVLATFVEKKISWRQGDVQPLSEVVVVAQRFYVFSGCLRCSWHDFPPHTHEINLPAFHTHCCSNGRFCDVKKWDQDKYAYAYYNLQCLYLAAIKF